ILVSYVLDAIDSVPIVTTGQAFIAEMPFFGSIAKPGGRVTGFIRLPSSLAKRVELLQGFCRSIRRVGYLASTDVFTERLYLNLLAAEAERLKPSGAIVIPIYTDGIEVLPRLPRLVRELGLDALDIGVWLDQNQIPLLESTLAELGIPHIYN